MGDSRRRLRDSSSSEAPKPYLEVIGAIYGLYGDNGKENGSYYLGFRV